MHSYLKGILFMAQLYNTIKTKVTFAWYTIKVNLIPFITVAVERTFSIVTIGTQCLIRNTFINICKMWCNSLFMLFNTTNWPTLHLEPVQPGLHRQTFGPLQLPFTQSGIQIPIGGCIGFSLYKQLKHLNTYHYHKCLLSNQHNIHIGFLPHTPH